MTTDNSMDQDTKAYAWKDKLPFLKVIQGHDFVGKRQPTKHINPCKEQRIPNQRILKMKNDSK